MAYINEPTANPTGATGHGYDSGSYGQVGPMDTTGHGSNTDQSDQKYEVVTINPIGATGHGSNTNPSGQIDTTGHSNSNTANGQVSDRPNINPATTNPTGATGHGSTTVYSGGQAENKPTINPDAIGHSAEEKKATTDLYMSDGDDYYIDDNAFSNAQMGTGDNKTVESVAGSKTAESVAGSSSGGSDGSETNSNVNTGVFGGPARAAHPGYSLW